MTGVVEWGNIVEKAEDTMVSPAGSTNVILIFSLKTLLA